VIFGATDSAIGGTELVDSAPRTVVEGEEESGFARDLPNRPVAAGCPEPLARRGGIEARSGGWADTLESWSTERERVSCAQSLFPSGLETWVRALD